MNVKVPLEASEAGSTASARKRLMIAGAYFVCTFLASVSLYVFAYRNAASFSMASVVRSKAIASTSFKDSSLVRFYERLSSLSTRSASKMWSASELMELYNRSRGAADSEVLREFDELLAVLFVPPLAYTVEPSKNDDLRGVTISGSLDYEGELIPMIAEDYERLVAHVSTLNDYRRMYMLNGSLPFGSWEDGNLGGKGMVEYESVEHAARLYARYLKYGPYVALYRGDFEITVHGFAGTREGSSGLVRSITIQVGIFPLKSS